MIDNGVEDVIMRRQKATGSKKEALILKYDGLKAKVQRVRDNKISKLQAELTKLKEDKHLVKDGYLKSLIVQYHHHHNTQQCHHHHHNFIIFIIILITIIIIIVLILINITIIVRYLKSAIDHRIQALTVELATLPENIQLQVLYHNNSHIIALICTQQRVYNHHHHHHHHSQDLHAELEQKCKNLDDGMYEGDDSENTSDVDSSEFSSTDESPEADRWKRKLQRR
jgi:hypothetical protein